MYEKNSWDNINIYFGKDKFDLLKNHRIYSGNCSTGTVCGNVFKENYAGFVPVIGSISSFDYNQLCGIRYRDY